MKDGSKDQLGEILLDGSYAESVEEFAQDKGAFYSVFEGAFLKMINLGQDESALKKMEEGFIDDDYFLRETIKTQDEVFSEHWFRN